MKYLLFFAIVYEIYASYPNGTFPNVSKDKCYFIPHSTKQFIQAEMNCKQQNGDLASIANAFDNNALRGKKIWVLFLRAPLVSERRKLCTGRIDAHSEQRYMQFCVCHK